MSFSVLRSQLFGAGLLCALAAGCSGSNNAGPAAPPPAPTATPGPTLQSTIKNVIVIYQENWSFDSLYGRFPGANGLNNASPANYGQIDKMTGAAITTLPRPLNNGAPDPNFPAGCRCSRITPHRTRRRTPSPATSSIASTSSSRRSTAGKWTSS